MTITVERMSAAGNAFHLVVEPTPPPAAPAEFARALCRGEGLRALAAAPPAAAADGLILCDFEAGRPRQRMFNPDGSRGHCANGLRCLGALLARLGRLPADGVILTDVGALSVDPGPERVSARLARARGLAGFPAPTEVCMLVVAGRELSGHAVDVGNAQFVVFGDAALLAALPELGPAIQGHERFADGVNLQLVHRYGTEWRIRVWERGAGETPSCGTGALAVAAAGPDALGVGESRTLSYPGGDLEVRLDAEGWLHLAGPVLHEGGYVLPGTAASVGAEKDRGGAI